ncbi:hypothetical protein VPG91_11485 [Nitrospirillum amazonense]|uniref:hypothetical protein n=1 Tax=Nitrospirillum amazonense TaxID=28077 RepID=UPI002DD41C7C|nr:hypothetical protein [Nitrospirillum amazonense]MEC4591611.1 hypothetical protein [Nitrospirillum amazonense]
MKMRNSNNNYYPRYLLLTRRLHNTRYAHYQKCIESRQYDLFDNKQYFFYPPYDVNNPEEHALSGVDPQDASPTIEVQPNRIKNDNSHQELLKTAPVWGEVILSFFCPVSRQEEVIGDLQEFYETRWLPRLGPRWACFVYLWHCCSISARFAKDGVLAGIVKAVGKALGRSIAGGS